MGDSLSKEQQEKDVKQLNEQQEKDVKQLNEQQEKDVKQVVAGIEAEVTGTTKGEPETELKTLECDKTRCGHLGKRVCVPDPTDIEPDLKKKMVEDAKTEDVADAAPSKGEGVASKKNPEQVAVNVPKSSPGTPKTAPTTPKGTASQEINPINTPAGPKLTKDDEPIEGMEPEVTKTTDDGIDATKPETEDETAKDTGKDTGKADETDEDPREDGEICERIES
ncbi:hypothetical protein KR038_007845 [Drosophila bunnanda]|nr:hypothetical protein KR038_007845 [Drosophila bunnanda]